MVTLSQVRQRVDALFDALPAELAHWPDPHPNRSPHDDEYSRVTNPERWRIVSARADAWVGALTHLDLATVTANPAFGWAETSTARIEGVGITRTELVVPRAAGALALTVAHTGSQAMPDTNVILGVGIPARLHLEPDCYCDACDSGSQDALDVVDEHITDVITGAYRNLVKGSKSITIGEHGQRGSGVSGRELDQVLANPKGWSELTGTSWLGSPSSSIASSSFRNT